jgi:ABC-type phosphate transport system substrate-binding protein
VSGRAVLVLICGLLLLLQPLLANTDEAGFVVIVNDSNPVDELRAEQLSKIFMKRVVTWIGGNQIMPVDQLAESQVRRDFSESIHGKPPAPIVAYWQQQIFSGRSIPPPERRTDEEVIEYVQENQSAIGYVSSQVKLVTGIKVISVIE